MNALSAAAPTVDGSLLTAAQAENARLIAMLEAHGIEWRLPPEPVPVKAPPVESFLSKPQKVALFRGLFSGRTDVFPERWENKSKGKYVLGLTATPIRRDG